MDLKSINLYLPKYLPTYIIQEYLLQIVVLLDALLEINKKVIFQYSTKLKKFRLLTCELIVQIANLEVSQHCTLLSCKHPMGSTLSRLSLYSVHCTLFTEKQLSKINVNVIVTTHN